MAARNLFWGRNMNKDIERWIAESHICNQTQKVPKERVVSKWKEV